MRRLEFLTVETFAAFCAELVRQGITFTGSETHAGLFTVTLQGY
jgi:hypothetical protein